MTFQIHRFLQVVYYAGERSVVKGTVGVPASCKNIPKLVSSLTNGKHCMGRFSAMSTLNKIITFSLASGFLLLCSCFLLKNNPLLRKEKFTGVYWGAFDPPTKAHQAVINAAISNPSITDLFIVVNNNSYKTYTNELDHRVKLIEGITSPITSKKIRVLWQDNKNPLDYHALQKMSPHPLCAIAGYDAYKNWIKYSSEEDRAQYKAIAVIPRGDDLPILYDRQAFLLRIDTSYKYVSSTRVRACASSSKDAIKFSPASDRNAVMK